jgi:type I restriction enzyme S subunit
MRLPRYPEYKDSGAAWLGAVPAHWTVKRFKWLIERNDGGVWGDDPDGTDDTLVLRSTEQTVDGQWKLEDPAFRKLTESDKRSSMLMLGDLLVTKSSGSSLHIGKTTLVDEQVAALSCCYSNFMQRIRLSDDLIPKLAWYVMNNDLARVQFDLLSNSTTGLANLNGTMISEIGIPVASRVEQDLIATFLDRETAKIDALIAEQEKLITLLAEKRQATISHAITRGLNPEAPMKDSGVTWLGEVPENWSVTCIKRVVLSIEQGWSPQCENFPVTDQSEWGVLKVGCVNGGVFQPTENKKLPQELDPIPSYALKRGDLLVSRANTRDLVGSAAVVPMDFDNLLLCDKLYRLRAAPELCSPEYLAAFLSTGVARSKIEVSATGASSSMLNISQAVILELPAPMPSVVEQRKILDFLHAESSRIDILTTEAISAIALLKERRSALIAAAVTGQIDVRGTMPPPPSPEESTA